MGRILLPILVIGVLLLSACGIPTTPQATEAPPTPPPTEEPAPASTPSEEGSPQVTVLLEFGELAADDEEAKWENELGRWKPATAVIDGQEKELTSAYFKGNTYVRTDDLVGVLLVFEWNEEGSKLSEQITERLVGKPLGIFIGDESLRGDNGQPIAPIIYAVIITNGQIEGLSLNEANALSMLLNTSE
jgi:hypothetical protein